MQRIEVNAPLSGMENMKLDGENFKKSQEMSKEDYFIRFYEWKSPCISLGFSQDSSILKEEVCQEEEVEIVKRITGGLAVYHYREITYSIAASNDSVYLGGGLFESYEKIADLLLKFLNSLGIKADLVRKKLPREKRSAICYQYHGVFEITVKGKKLIGSAQKRGQNGFLQHGSIPVYKRDRRLEDYLKESFVQGKKTSYLFLEEVLNKPASINQLKSTLVKQTQDYLNELKKKLP